jgi:hypothetical protein
MARRAVRTLGYNSEMATCILLLLFRLLLVVAAYAVEFFVFWQYPMPDRLFFIIPGTLLGLLLVLIKMEQIVGVLGLAGFTIIGALIGFMAFGPKAGQFEEGRWAGFLGAAFGAAVGGLLGLGYSAIRRGEERVEPEMDANERE